MRKGPHLCRVNEIDPFKNVFRKDKNEHYYKILNQVHHLNSSIMFSVTDSWDLMKARTLGFLPPSGLFMWDQKLNADALLINTFWRDMNNTSKSLLCIKLWIFPLIFNGAMLSSTLFLECSFDC